jgi:transcriptional regulator with XRE-family HTH domain
MRVDEPRERKEDLGARLALVLLRASKDWDQSELARQARMAPSQISGYERGERPVPRKALEKAAAAVEFPAHLLDPLLWSIRSYLAAAGGRSRASRVLAEGVMAELMTFVQMVADLVLEPLSHARRTGPARPTAEDRGEAEVLWARLERRDAELRRLLVEEGEEYQSWAVCERAAAASREAAAAKPREALELAELALRIAELVPGKPLWRQRLRGYALAHVSHARRSCGDLTGAGEAWTRANQLWETGAPGDPGLLDEAVVRNLGASE